MKRRHFLHAGLGATVVSALGCGPAPERKRPNILFILADQFRADAVGVAGNTFVHTPNLDRMAREGVHFINAYTPQALCAPTRASLLTGVYPFTHGLRDNVYNVESVLAMPEYQLRPNWPELLREAGYYTGYLGKWHLGDADPGIFDHYRGYNSQWPHWLGEKYESPYRPDTETDEALEFLDKHRDKTFSLTISYYPPHDPFEAPIKYHALYEDKGIEFWEYYAAVSAIDWNVGRMLDKLDELGLARDTMVIFTSEHGETFGKRAGHPHKRVSYDESAKAPMIVRYPALLPAGAVYEGGVLNIDLMPMILEAAGLPIPERVEAKSRIGEILNNDMAWKEPVFHMNVFNRYQPGEPHIDRMVRWRGWKLILRNQPLPDVPPRDELYNLDADPQEQNDLLARPESKPKVQELARLLLEWGHKMGEETAVEFAGRYVRQS